MDPDAVAMVVTSQTPVENGWEETQEAVSSVVSYPGNTVRIS